MLCLECDHAALVWSLAAHEGFRLFGSMRQVASLPRPVTIGQMSALRSLLLEGPHIGIVVHGNEELRDCADSVWANEPFLVLGGSSCTGS